MDVPARPYVSGKSNIVELCFTTTPPHPVPDTTSSSPNTRDRQEVESFSVQGEFTTSHLHTPCFPLYEDDPFIMLETALDTQSNNGNVPAYAEEKKSLLIKSL